MKFGFKEEDFFRESKDSDKDYHICPFKKYKGIPWDEVPFDYKFWLLEQDHFELHPAYEKAIKNTFNGWTKCENGHVWNTTEAEECFYCEMNITD